MVCFGIFRTRRTELSPPDYGSDLHVPFSYLPMSLYERANLLARFFNAGAEQDAVRESGRLKAPSLALMAFI